MAFLTKRSNGRYYIVFMDHTGKQRMKSTGTQNKAVANQRLDHCEKKQAEEKWSDDKNPPVEEFRELYVKWSAKYLTRKTRESQLGRWDRFIAWRKPKRMGDISAQDIREFIDYLLEQPDRGGRTVSNTTINNYLRDISALFGHAIGKDMEVFNGKNPVVGIKRLRIEENKPPFLKLEEVERLLSSAQVHSEDMYIWCLLGLYCGLRLAEASYCRWEYFEWDQKLLKLPSPEGQTLKSHKAREIPLPENLIAILEPMSKSREFIFTPRADNAGRNHYRVDPKKGFHTVCLNAGLEGVTFHWLRHTYGTQQTLAGTPTALLKTWMGHSSEVTTARYQHVIGHHEAVNNFAPPLAPRRAT